MAISSSFGVLAPKCGSSWGYSATCIRFARLFSGWELKLGLLAGRRPILGRLTGLVKSRRLSSRFEELRKSGIFPLFREFPNLGRGTDFLVGPDKEDIPAPRWPLSEGPGPLETDQGRFPAELDWAQLGTGISQPVPKNPRFVPVAPPCSYCLVDILTRQ